MRTFLTPSSCLLSSLCLQGSHGLTLRGSPKARSRWEAKLLAARAGRCWRAQAGCWAQPAAFPSSGREDLGAALSSSHTWGRRTSSPAHSVLKVHGWAQAGQGLMRSSRRAQSASQVSLGPHCNSQHMGTAVSTNENQYLCLVCGSV